MSNYNKTKNCDLHYMDYKYRPLLRESQSGTWVLYFESFLTEYLKSSASRPRCVRSWLFQRLLCKSASLKQLYHHNWKGIETDRISLFLKDRSLKDPGESKNSEEGEGLKFNVTK